ncbi:MAG: spore cortex-lytic enzyme [Caldicoprobacterales bacterium]|jgi:N-acetylmuramoyl-L-alanine amidase
MGTKRRLIILSIMVALFLCVSLADQYYFNRHTADAASLYWGSTGSKVSEVQRKLKQWGYYDGPIDGVFGQKTYEAVVFFQRRNGLRQDGVIGPQTANALGIQLTAKAPAQAPSSSGQSGSGNSNDVYLLAKAVHGEARGEPYIGKVAVAAVILNRVKHPDFPNTIAGVIYQPLAFTAVADGQINLTPDEESIRAARDALNGWDPTYGAIYYYNPAKATSKWIWSRPVHIVIGKHRFAT